MIVWLVLIVLALAALCLFALAPGRGAASRMAAFDRLNCAHRGLHEKDRSVPENSLPAFRAAAQAGYGIELDVQLSKDEEVVVFHDDTLERVCGVRGRVDAFTLQQLGEMRLCGTAERIPLFTEVLDAVAGRAPMIVELKSGPRNDELCEKGLRLLRGYQQRYPQAAFCVESFDPRIVAWFRKNAPDILRGQLAHPAKEYAHMSFPLRFALANLLGNAAARPQFVAYEYGPKAPGARLCEALGAVRVCWTVRSAADGDAAQRQNDTVIFEHYRPAPRWR